MSRHRSTQSFICITGFILSILACSDANPSSTTNNNGSENENSNQNFQAIYFTGPDYDIPSQVKNYAYGDTIYILGLERHGYRPNLSPIWLYTYSGDKEAYLMDRDRPLPITFPEDYATGLSVYPDTTQIHVWYDGILQISSVSDSITAFYFSQEHTQLTTVGARIGGIQK